MLQAAEAHASPTTNSAAPLTLACCHCCLQIMVPHPTIFNSNMTCKEAARIMIQKDVSGAPVVGALCALHTI